MRITIAVLACVAAASCGGSPTAPSQPTIPSVSGSYSGSVTIVYPDISATLVCPATTTVTQSGSAVNIAPIVTSGQCGGLTITLGAASIDATGALPNESTTLNDPTCGNSAVTFSGGFVGRELRLMTTSRSATCRNFDFSATLTR